MFVRYSQDAGQQQRDDFGLLWANVGVLSTLKVGQAKLWRLGGCEHKCIFDSQYFQLVVDLS